MGGRTVALILVLAATLTCGAGAAVALTDRFCLDCHADRTLTKTDANGKEISVFVDRTKLDGSVHATNQCVSCHADVTAKHPDDNKAVQPVQCATCHEQQTRSY